MVDVDEDENVDRDTSTASEELEPNASCLSDESSFYGDDELKAEYEQRAATFNPREFWEYHERDLQTIAARGREKSQAEQKRGDAHRKVLHGGLMKEGVGPDDKKHEPMQDCMPMDLDHPSNDQRPYNPYEGDDMAKQLNETLESFLSRLPPSGTTVESGPWIWIANPFSARRASQGDIGGFNDAGNELLEEYIRRRRALEDQNPEKAPGTITRKLKADREWLEKSINKAARDKGVTHGKWMLFPSSNHVDEIWCSVAKGTLTGTLGCAAKVATDDGSDKVRLICIYTEDCFDQKDVRRVLERLKDMHLVRSGKGEQGIYYKCDAYTHLDIMSGNVYNLKASMYSSKELLSKRT